MDPQIVPRGPGYALIRADGAVLAQGNILDCKNALAAWRADREAERRRARDGALRRALGGGAAWPT